MARTNFALMKSALFDVEPRGLIEAWTRTTAGLLALLLALQFLTGALLAFYYVPSTESAHTTVAFIEKVQPAGSWLRALHHYGSQLLTLALVLHLVQLFWREAYRRRPVTWMAHVLLLALVLSNGATGYSLPWDARAFFGTRVAEGLAGGLPLVGAAARRWLLGGAEISALTLVRFYALHLLAVPALILLTIVACLFIFKDSEATSEGRAPSKRLDQPLSSWQQAQAARQLISAGVLFLLLSLYALKYPAPLGPAADAVSPDYLPRPGLQFLWLFQMLKYLPGRPGSIVALGFPGLLFACLLVLPFLKRLLGHGLMDQPRRRIGSALLALSLIFFFLMTALALIEDRRDPRIQAQLAHQADEERAFRARPFEPLKLRSSEGAEDEAQGSVPGARAEGSSATAPSSSSISGARPAAAPASGAAPAPAGPINSSGPPQAYLDNCANCHGTRGQGFSIFPKLKGVSSKPRRSVEDLIAIMDDPAAYGLKPPMKSFSDKMTKDEERQVALWIASLKAGK